MFNKANLLLSKTKKRLSFKIEFDSSVFMQADAVYVRTTQDYLTFTEAGVYEVDLHGVSTIELMIDAVDYNDYSLRIYSVYNWDGEGDVYDYEYYIFDAYEIFPREWVDVSNLLEVKDEENSPSPYMRINYFGSVA